MRLTTNEKQSLSDQLRGTGGWRPTTNERAAEIEAIFNADDEAVKADQNDYLFQTMFSNSNTMTVLSG